MNTDNLHGDDAPAHGHEGGARIEDLPASDNQIRAEERERPSVLRAPPGEPDEPEDAQGGSPSPRDPEE